MRSKKINDSFYRFESLLPEEQFISVADEFNLRYNGLMPKRGETEYNRNTLRLGLYKPKYESLYTQTCLQLGDNHQFLNVATRLKLIAERAINKKLQLRRINTNIQFPGQESGFHIDGDEGVWTFLLFTPMFGTVL